VGTGHGVSQRRCRSTAIDMKLRPAATGPRRRVLRESRLPHREQDNKMQQVLINASSRAYWRLSLGEDDSHARYLKPKHLTCFVVGKSATHLDYTLRPGRVKM